MGRGFEKPEVEEQVSAQAQQKEQIKQLDTSVGIPTAVPTTSPADIHKNGFNVFVEFLAGNVHNANEEERADFQVKYINNLATMLAVDTVVVNDVLDHMVRTIHANRRHFGMNSLYAPLRQVEAHNLAPRLSIERYKKFMSFMVNLTDNASRRAVFVANYDVRSLVSQFPPKVAQNLNNYIYR